MNALKWLRESHGGPVHPVYAVSGDDAYLIREAIQTVVRTVVPGEDAAGAVTRFAGPQAVLAHVLDELWTLPFFSKSRVVIVDEADSFISKHRRELEAYVESPSRSATLILQSKQWLATTKLAKLVDKLGLAINCMSPREAELADWLVELARARDHVELDPDAARLLVELIGPEVGILASEVEKLSVYAGDSQRVARQDVARMVGAGRAMTVWHALDAATAGQGALALEHLDTLLAAGEYATPLLAAMSANLLKIYHSGQLRAGRVSLEEACRAAGIPPFATDKTRRQHAHLGPERVDQLPEWLLRADLDLKGGSALDPRVVLERLLIRLAVKRRD